jgi:hypothetical protein
MIRYRYTFRCPLCAKIFKYDEPGEPCCTGPSETRDEHPMEIMRLVAIGGVDVDPFGAEKRADGALIMPNMTDVIEREARAVHVRHYGRFSSSKL